MAKIGILGGTFDPIHLGHLQMAVEAYRQAELDQVLFMPAKIPPHKQGQRITEAVQRADMIRLAIEGRPEFIYSDFELQREGTTYTADTLQLLQERYPEHEFYFILGGDSLFHLEEWYHPEKIMERSVLLAISRYGIVREEIDQQVERLTNKYHARIQVVEMARMDISSSEIRDRVMRGKSIDGLVPDPVAEYIRRHALYVIG